LGKNFGKRAHASLVEFLAKEKDARTFMRFVQEVQKSYSSRNGQVA